MLICFGTLTWLADMRQLVKIVVWDLERGLVSQFQLFPRLPFPQSMMVKVAIVHT